MAVAGLLARVLCVFALLGATLWVLQRVDGRRRGPRRSAPVQVIASTRLAKGAALSVVQVGDTEYVLGVTDAAVSLLSSRSAATPEARAEGVPTTVNTPSTGPTDPTGPSSSPAAPGAASFLADTWRVLRGRTLASDELSTACVAAALDAVTAPDGPARHDPGADGSVPGPASASRREPSGTDAPTDQEYPWAGPDRMPQPARGGAVPIS